MTITLFKSKTSTKPESYTELETVLMAIKSDRWKDKILRVRQDIKKKDYLPAFTPTGVFNYRSIAGLESYNGVICLDLDNIENPEAIKESIKKYSWVHSCFITPSGFGLKVIIKTTAVKEDYTIYEEQFAAYWAELGFPPRDQRAKDISRISYISWDPNLYYNPNSTTFNILKPTN